jgi:hypothetical protein
MAPFSGVSLPKGGVCVRAPAIVFSILAAKTIEFPEKWV